MKVFPLIFIFVMTHLFLNAKEVVVTPPCGDSFVLDVEPSTSFFDVVEQIEECLVEQDKAQDSEALILEGNKDISISYTLGFPGIFARKAKERNQPRNYGHLVTPEEKENIRFIILSLAKHSMAQLAKAESSLKRVGDKIRHIHPFRFLQCVFTDEELKVGLFAIRHKSLVWGEYYDGLKKSLNEESDFNNLVHFTSDFANNIGVNVNAIMPLVQTRQWSALVDVLINSIPRQGNPDRYGM